MYCRLNYITLWPGCMQCRREVVFSCGLMGARNIGNTLGPTTALTGPGCMQENYMVRK